MSSPTTTDWSGDTVLADAHVPIPSHMAAALAAQAANEPGSWSFAPSADTLSAELAPVMAAVRAKLEAWPGFVVVTGFPAGFSDYESPRRLVWQFGQHLGRVATQDVRGTLIYEVVDTGQSVSSGARLSVTNKATGIHTDNSFEETVPHYIALYCINQAQDGGMSQLVSGHAVVKVLSETAPAAFGRLQEPVLFDRRGGVLPGAAEYASYPVINQTQGNLKIRYLRTYIEAGYVRAGQEIDAVTTSALDAFDAACCQPGLAVELSLSPRQMLIVNNHCILHGRTAFTDGPDLTRRLLRLWINPRDKNEETEKLLPRQCSPRPADERRGPSLADRGTPIQKNRA